MSSLISAMLVFIDREDVLIWVRNLIGGSNSLHLVYMEMFPQ
jgi:hypothetical protein